MAGLWSKVKQIYNVGEMQGVVEKGQKSLQTMKEYLDKTGFVDEELNDLFPKFTAAVNRAYEASKKSPYPPVNA